MPASHDRLRRPVAIVFGLLLVPVLAASSTSHLWRNGAHRSDPVEGGHWDYPAAHASHLVLTLLTLGLQTSHAYLSRSRRRLTDPVSRTHTHRLDLPAKISRVTKFVTTLVVSSIITRSVLRRQLASSPASLDAEVLTTRREMGGQSSDDSLVVMVIWACIGGICLACLVVVTCARRRRVQRVGVTARTAADLRTNPVDAFF